jgi:hypothetical protein
MTKNQEQRTKNKGLHNQCPDFTVSFQSSVGRGAPRPAYFYISGSAETALPDKTMSDSSDPAQHQRYEQQFITHVERLLTDERLRLDTTRGRRPVITMIRDVTTNDKGVELKRLMSEMGKPDRDLEARMPKGKTIEVTLSQQKWWVLKNRVGQLRVLCVSPSRALLSGESGAPISSADLKKILSEIPPPISKTPQTVVIMSTSGFAQTAREAAERGNDRTVILVAPNEAGGWTVTGPSQTKSTSDLFDPEADTEKRQRLREQIEAARVELLAGGVAADTLAGRSKLPAQFVEAELKSYAKENPGLTAKRLDGRVVLFREGAAPLGSPDSGRGADMPFIERVKALFARKGEIEKKIAFLSERRAALSQQRDRSYEDMQTMETKEADLRKEFKDASGDIARRRITSQLLQFRKDIERRQQLLSVLNQQINVVSTHLHNLELQQQGKTASLPNSEEMASDAAAAEEVLAELEANSELADSVASAATAGMSAEEQALYEELMNEQSEPPKAQPTQ